MSITQLRFAVSTLAPALNEKAQQLAMKLHLPFVPHFDEAAITEYDYLLLFTPHYLGLHPVSDKKFAPFHIDFLSGKMFYRTQQASLRRESLARAIGFKPSEHPRILDATAGLGRDSFILAKLGFEVTLLERSPILHALLQDALDRAQASKTFSSLCQRLQLIHADALDWLKQRPVDQRPDVIYLDPMFPERQKTASVKKEMVILQNLLGKDTDADQLFQLALTCATRRVVVKRPRLAPNVTGSAPSFSMAGKSSRFDIYLV